jgi:hypothetical protein
MPARNILRFELRRLFGLPLLSAEEESGAPAPLESELLFDLTGENPENRLFGRYGPEELRAHLGASGLLAGLSERGYPDPILRLSCADSADQRICLYAGEETRGRLLFEVRLQLAPFHPRRPIGSFTKETSFRMLVINWLVLSSPDGTFTVDRPRLPGQERPGLGLLNQTIALLKSISRELSVDGVLDVPDHFHTALFYSRAFRYLAPEVEGRFLAIVRDLSGIPLTLASDAIREGCLVDRKTGASISWPAAEQVLALRGPLSRFLHSPSYREARNRALADHRFVVNWDLYRKNIALRDRP